ncbi:hypothetical protein CBER1_08720 [Cercospora berteroae]|uniref:beta-glucosidase n=1 Tax=Cercospora berteroae TaxID=357750 RepID=A0A2S6CAE2_9PEZI|nr:hypothetical protein CBER1_08720 [Cercospora berteroae]
MRAGAVTRGLLASAALCSAQNITFPYQNASLSIDDRLDDLISRMTLAEKAGQLFHPYINYGPNGTLEPLPREEQSMGGNDTRTKVGEMYLSHFILGDDITNVTVAVEWHNAIQELARNSTRLGIPITMSSDPRNLYSETVGGGVANKLSQWPNSLGLAALRSPALAQKFAEVVREEYKALGFRTTLSPQIDLATEYRWARIPGTFGEDANLTSEYVVATLRGFHGEEFGVGSVNTMSKHFPGAGPAENGEDGHFEYGKNQTYPGNNFDAHLVPFKAAIAAGERQIMPYYTRPIGTEYEEVAFAYNKGIITDLLKTELGFTGIVCSDWGIVTDTEIAGQTIPAQAWGLESLGELERVARILNAGVDQLGGEERPELIIQLVEEGNITEERVEQSARRLLREKFVLGLFDNPFVTVERAEEIVGNDEYVRLGLEAQRASLTLLTNEDEILPLKDEWAGKKVYIEGFPEIYLEGRGLEVVEDVDDADLAILRLIAPSEPREGGFSQLYAAGSLEFNVTEQARQAAIYEAVPTIVDITLERPAAIPEIIEQAAAVLGSYGSGPAALLDVLFGVNGAEPRGRLPFDLPRSTEAVEESAEDVPFDTRNPVFTFGHGLTYGSAIDDVWTYGVA